MFDFLLIILIAPHDYIKLLPRVHLKILSNCAFSFCPYITSKIA